MSSEHTHFAKGFPGSPKTNYLLLFGDLSFTSFDQQLRRLLHNKSNPLLVSFFEQVRYHLTRSLGTLPSKQQDLLPRFTDLVDLVSRYGETQGTPILTFFLFSVHQVAQAISLFSKTATFPSPSQTYAIGPCAGGFAAAAVCCSHNVHELVSNGVAAALAAFHTALLSYLNSQTLCVRKCLSAQKYSWSVLVDSEDDIDFKSLIDEQSLTHNLNRCSGLWVSSITSLRSGTISGLPSTLQRFIELTSSLRRCRFLDIESPYHAPHLYTEYDAKLIINTVFRDDLAGTAHQPLLIPLMSSASGQVSAAHDFRSVLFDVVHEALRLPIRWDLILSSSCERLHACDAKQFDIINFNSAASTLLSSRFIGDMSIKTSVSDVTAINADTDAMAFLPTRAFEKSKIAIIGYSGRFPSAASNEAFWELLKAGRDVHQEIPSTRFDWKAHYDPSGKTKNTSRVKYGCFIDEPGVFDARFFNMSPKEAENTDPAQRLAITTAYEALEMAGLVPNRTPSTQKDRIGVFFGTTSDDWREVNSGQDVGTYFIPGGNRAFVPGRISYFFGFSGPSLSIDTACSSSFAAIQSACAYLWRGDCDTAVAGGTNILTNPDNFAGLDRGHFLSTTGNCNAFDNDASGYCRSEAVGSVILKRLEDAEADHDPIFGVIAGTTTNHCGQTDSITRPHEGDQASVFERIVRHADIDPLNVSYVEMHGTGTQAGDATEMNSVLSVFTKGYTRTESGPERPLYLGSAKANIGHAEAASGVSSLIKVLMMMKHSEIPRHCGIKTKINQNYPLDLSQRGVHIASKTVPWTRAKSSSETRVAFLNNFSAAGGNTAILLKDAPKSVSIDTEEDRRPTHIITVSAKTPASLIANMESLALVLQNEGINISLPALSYTTTARRMHYKYRIAVNGDDKYSILSSLRTALQDFQSSKESIKPIPTSKHKSARVIFVFSGQGSLYKELAKSLFTTSASFRSNILRLDAVAQRQNFPSFLGIIDGSTFDDAISNAKAVVIQLALTCVQMALTDLWKGWGLSPAAVIGHSLGEYAALYAAEVLSAADVIYLVGTRAKLLEEKCTAGTHAMLSIQASFEQVSTLLAKNDPSNRCEIACINASDSCVIAGPESNIIGISSAAVTAKMKAVMLDIPFAFHSAQVEPLLGDFEQAAQKEATFHAPKVPYLSPLLGKIVLSGEANTLNASYLRNACRNRVDFVSAINSIDTRDDIGLGGLDTIQWLEIGPAPVCCGMVKRTIDVAPSQIHTSLRRDKHAYTTITATLKGLYMAGIDLSWNEFHRDFPAAQKVVDLPSYRWDLQNYWIQYRNNFCLSKGDLPEGYVSTDRAIEKPLETKYISPCAQRVISETHSTDASSISVESDIFDPQLLPILEGHLVNGVALCPSSLYADVALTLADYLMKLRPADKTAQRAGFEVINVQIDKPLIAQLTDTSHYFGVVATASWSSNMIRFNIFSLDSQKNRTTTHCTLDVRVIPEQDWLRTWERSAHLISSRIEALARSADDNDSHDECNRIKRRMAYKLFSVLVNYSAEYQGMSEVIINGENLEAVTKVNFQVGKSDFYIDPRWIDSLGQVAGFIMNANDEHTSKEQVFINHGWQRIRIARPFDATKTYRAYNRMHLVENTTYSGDTYILDGDRIVAIYEGVTFKGIPRRVLEHVLPDNKARATGPSAAPKPQMRPQPVPIQQPSLSSAIIHSVKAPAAQPLDNSEALPYSSAYDNFLAIIGEEIGIEVATFKNDSEFTELGVDSLLSLNIIAKAREKIKLELPSSLFADCTTIQDLKSFFQADDETDNTYASSTLESELSSVFDSSEQSTLHTPPTEGPTPLYGPPAEQTLKAHLKVATLLREIVSEETGVEKDSLQPSTNLLEIGVDSLLGLTISSRLQEAFAQNVASSIFMEYETMQEVEKAIAKLIALEQTETTVSLQDAATQAPTHTDNQDKRSGVLNQTPQSALPAATSVLLSGKPQTAKQICFLFPDGSGSASSYVAFAEAFTRRDVAIYGLNCPWRKNPTDMTRIEVDMRTMVGQYIIEVQRILKDQDSIRSVIFGGWSAGGILAFEGVRQLQRKHIRVDQLILLDSPDPIGLQNPPKRMYDFFDSLGIFGSKGKTPKWLREHFDAFLRVLDDYKPLPLPDAPKTLIVYARDGVCKDPAGPYMETFPDDPREMLWLLNKRTDFSANGWSSIVGRQNLKAVVVDNVNHFTLMDIGPVMEQTAHIVGDFLS